MPAALTAFFDRVCVLSLPHREARRQELSSHLEALGLVERERLTWIDAVAGELCPAPTYFRGGDGAWGCLQTHSRVVQDAAMQGAKSCLILEDDVIFHPKSAEWLERVLLNLPASWEQLYLGGQHLKEPQELFSGSTVWRATNVNRTHAYALHRRVYARFLRHIHQAPDYLARDTSWHLDHQLGLAHEKGLWQTYCPAWWLAGQRAGESSVSGQCQPERWWQPARYARGVPFVFVPAGGGGLTSMQVQALSARVHFGNHRREGTLVDAGLDKVASGYAGLGEWLDLIAREALELCLLPGISHPAIDAEAVARQWEKGVEVCSAVDEWPNLASLGDYPANGVFAHPLCSGGNCAQ